MSISNGEAVHLDIRPVAGKIGAEIAWVRLSGDLDEPAFITWPGFAHQHEISSSFTTVMDLLPTFLDLAGVPHPGDNYKGRKIEKARGRSMAGYLRGEADAVHPRNQATGWELFGRRGIRQGDWKAVFIPPPEGPGIWQLYNLENDPGEITDLAETYSPKLAELLRLWDEYVEQTGVLLNPPQHLD